MLILRRHRGQSIVIGRHAEIIIKILQEEKGIITVGIEAPKSVQIDREEVYCKREAELQAPEFSEELTAQRGYDHVSA